MSTKRTKYAILGSILACIVALGLFYYVNWIKPYELPEIKENLTIEEYGLDFKDERELKKAIKENNFSDNQVTQFNESITLLNGTKIDKEKGIKNFKKLIEDNPNNLEISNTLRLHMFKSGDIEEFISLMEEVPQTDDVKLQISLAYVDLLQNPDLGIAVLGQTSSSSIDVLNKILEETPDNWLARYARGINNLYWPVGLKRTESAIKDLSYCLAVVKSLEKEDDLALWPLTYEAYGDALVKEGKIKEGRAVWKEGHSKYPNSESLVIRSKANEEEAYEIVKQERGIEIFQRPKEEITDVSILWQE